MALKKISEYLQMHSLPLQKFFDNIDKDKNGVLDKNEFC
jgi:hypothetical protein